MASTALYSLPGVDLSNVTSVAVYYETHAVPQRYSAGIVVASIITSILGSYVTLFVLGKRTGNSGTRNIFLLLLGAATMSFVGIWGMHFIGMHMRLQATPSLTWYLNFNAGFTIFSLVVPALSLTFSFFFVDQDSIDFRLWKVVVAGTITGCTVALMHYSASFYCNFNVEFGAGQVVGSILLACILCTVGFTAFFRFRAQWQDSWWKRGLCAIILGVGVSSMHYIGASGTSYRVRSEHVNDAESLAIGKKRNDVLIIVIGGESALEQLL
jgi:NO-binding membrane sensor protein with MHYT domain